MSTRATRVAQGSRLEAAPLTHRSTTSWRLSWRRAWRRSAVRTRENGRLLRVLRYLFVASARMVEFGTISMSQWRQVLGRAPAVSSFIHESSHSTFAVSCRPCSARRRARKIARSTHSRCAPRGGGKEIDGVYELEVEVLPGCAAFSSIFSLSMTRWGTST